MTSSGRESHMIVGHEDRVRADAVEAKNGARLLGPRPRMCIRPPCDSTAETAKPRTDALAETGFAVAVG